jgi:hypothetical protein
VRADRLSSDTPGPLGTAGTIGPVVAPGVAATSAASTHPGASDGTKLSRVGTSRKRSASANSERYASGPQPVTPSNDGPASASIDARTSRWSMRNPATA